MIYKPNVPTNQRFNMNSSSACAVSSSQISCNSHVICSIFTLHSTMLSPVHFKKCFHHSKSLLTLCSFPSFMVFIIVLWLSIWTKYLNSPVTMFFTTSIFFFSWFSISLMSVELVLFCTSTFQVPRFSFPLLVALFQPTFVAFIVYLCHKILKSHLDFLQAALVCISEVNYCSVNE